MHYLCNLPLRLDYVGHEDDEPEHDHEGGVHRAAHYGKSLSVVEGISESALSLRVTGSTRVFYQPVHENRKVEEIWH